MDRKALMYALSPPICCVPIKSMILSQKRDEARMSLGAGSYHRIRRNVLKVVSKTLENAPKSVVPTSTKSKHALGKVIRLASMGISNRYTWSGRETVARSSSKTRTVTC